MYGGGVGSEEPRGHVQGQPWYGVQQTRHSGAEDRGCLEEDVSKEG